jgi:hypothetical protein
MECQSGNNYRTIAAMQDTFLTKFIENENSLSRNLLFQWKNNHKQN